MVGFTIQSITRTATGIRVRTTSGLETEFTGTNEEIHETLKSQVSDTDPLLLLRILMLRVMHFDRDLTNTAQFANKVCTFDIRQSNMISVV